MPPPPTAELRVVDAQRAQVVSRIAERDWGAVAIEELRACGLTDREVRTCVLNGWLHPWHRGVYAVGHRNLALEGRFMAAVDCAGVLREDELRRLVREAQGRRLVTLGELRAVLDRLAPCRGCRALRRIVATGPAPTRSELEDAVLDLMLRGGLAHPEVNAPLVLAGRRVVPDFRWPAQHLVVEADGAAWHEHRLAREADAERQALLESHGERVVRVTWEQAIQRGPQTLTRLVNAGAPAA